MMASLSHPCFMTPVYLLDRRREERMTDALPVTVRALNLTGDRIKITTTLTNISSGGLFLYLPFQVPLGSSLLALIHLPRDVRLIGKGRVMRTQIIGSDSIGVAVSFKRTRLLAQID
jgi:c-di-GMP-binding flagellar brake protein YcgR